MIKIFDVDIYPTKDFTLPWYDYSTLNAIERCPRKGILRYIAHKTAHIKEDDNTAPNAGNAIHAFCAAYNAFNNKEICYSLFGKDFVDELIQRELPDDADQRLCFALGVLDNCGFVDSENDKRRTEESIRKTCLYWAINHKQANVVSVEEPFDITIHIKFRDPSNRNVEFRYVGKIDLVRLNNNKQILPVDYKTTAYSLSPAFWAPFHLSPQFTGYQLALKCAYPDNEIASYVEVEGMFITKAEKSTALRYEVQQFERSELHNKLFFEFCIRNIDLANAYKDEPYNADMKHTNCGEYFKPCEFLTFCNSELDDRISMFNNEFAEHEWDPWKK